MSETPLVGNPLAWVHHRLRGGWRNAILLSVGYFVIMGGLMLAAVRANPHGVQQILYGWMAVLLALQMGILLLYGGVAVRNAVRRDFTTGMIFSHRLMPLSGTEAVAGYVAGAAPQPVAVAVANLLLGVIIAGPAQLPPLDWLMANAVLGLFAVCAWVTVTCASLVSPKSGGAILIVVVLIVLAGLLTLVPAFTVISSPVVGSTIFGVVIWGGQWSPVLHLSIVAQLAVTVLIFMMAARKYRREDVPAAGPLFGMLIVAVFVGASVIGIRNWSALQPAIATLSGDVRNLQTLGSMIAGVVVSFLPIAAAAWFQEDHRRRCLLRDPEPGRRPVNGVAVSFAAAALLLFIPWLSLPAADLNLSRLIATAVALTATLVPINYLFRLAYRQRAGVGFVLSLWIMLVWIGPWIISFGILASYGMDDALNVPEAWERSEVVASFSPVGSLIAIGVSGERRYLAGLAFQLVLSAAAAMLLHTRRSKEQDE